MQHNVAILGGGNIGGAIVRGLLKSKNADPERITVTRRRIHLLESFASLGVITTVDNVEAVKRSEIIIIAVRPRQMKPLLEEIAPSLDPSTHILVSVVTGFSMAEIEAVTSKKIAVIRAMPNTAIAVGESMTALVVNPEGKEKLKVVAELFEKVGRTYIIEENLMSAATILNACGIAYFLRVIRAISQGGIQIGFHASEAQLIASQVAKGAAELLLDLGIHPEEEIDKVTTPRGVTIAGLNEMEHHGLSSALIKGILASFNEIEKLK